MDKETIQRIMQATYERRGGRLGMTLREAEAQSGIAYATLSRLELGKVPDLVTFKKLCQWTGRSANYFLGLEEEDY